MVIVVAEIQRQGRCRIICRSGSQTRGFVRKSFAGALNSVGRSPRAMVDGSVVGMHAGLGWINGETFQTK